MLLRVSPKLVHSRIFSRGEEGIVYPCLCVVLSCLKLI